MTQLDLSSRMPQGEIRDGLNALKPMDDRDTRREVFYLLGKLTPRERIEFLQWCASVVTNQFLRHDPVNGRTVFIQDTTSGHVAEAYADFGQLVVHYGLDPILAANELERRVKTIWIPPGAR